MIHYTCDRCHRRIETAESTRYVVQVDITPVLPESFGDAACEADRDPLDEIHHQLSGLDDATATRADAPVTKQFDLCADCHDQFLESRLGLDPRPIAFSPN